MSITEELRAAIVERAKTAAARQAAGLAYAGSLRAIDPLVDALASAEAAADEALALATIGEGTQADATKAVTRREEARDALERAQAATRLLLTRQEAAAELHVRASKTAATLAIARCKLLVAAGAAELERHVRAAAELRSALLGVAWCAAREHKILVPYGATGHGDPPIAVEGRGAWYGATEALEALGVAPAGRRPDARSVTEDDLLGDALAELLNANPEPKV